MDNLGTLTVATSLSALRASLLCGSGPVPTIGAEGSQKGQNMNRPADERPAVRPTEPVIPEVPIPDADEKPANETIPGGAYLIGDRLYNANREPINEKGQVQKD
jgi:hypothetical protein